MTSDEKSQLDRLFRDVYKTLVELNPAANIEVSGRRINVDRMIFKDLEIQNVVDIWDLVKISAKYLMFDVEATRRERDFLLNHRTTGDQNCGDCGNGDEND